MPPKRPLVSDDESEYDDLDELLSDNEDDKPTGIAALLKGSLSIPRHTSTSVEHINKMIQQGDIELNPSYQRDVVWPEVKMIMLIQSLFLNYYIPPLIFAVETDELGIERRVCIDGKQRCTSIAHFMMGAIPFISPYTKEKFYYVMYEKKFNSKELPPALKKKFDNLQLFLVEYREITDQQQRDVFQRVQMGVSLSAAEKLAAIPGPWPTWIVELLKKYVAEVGTLSTAITWDQSRGRPFQIIAGFIQMAVDPNAKATIPSAQQLNKFLHRADPPDRHFKHKIEMALSLFVNIATEHFGESFGVVEQRVAPVEWCYTALLIFTRMGVLSVSSLAKAIGKMRTYIRLERGHVDVRSNTRVCADFAEYLRKLPKSRPNGELPAAEEFEGDDVDPRDIRAAKRARRGEESDPTYRDTATDRYDEAGLGRSTRAAANASATTTMTGRIATSPPGVETKPIINDNQDVPPPPPVQRPPAPAMDRPMPQWQPPPQQYNAGGLGTVPPSIQSTNPYTQRYQHPQAAMQQQHQRQMAYQQSQPQQQHPQYTPQQLAQFQAMHANQARQQAAANGGPRWANGR